MTTLKSIFRAAVLLSLSAIMLITLFAEPSETSESFLKDMLLTKSISAVSAFALWFFFSKWRKADRWISYYDNQTND